MPESDGLLEEILGIDGRNDFLSAAKSYFNDVDSASHGLFVDCQSTLVERSDIHPPKKQKVRMLLIAQLLNCNKDEATRFIREVWTKEKAIRTIAAKARTLVRQKDNAFGTIYAYAVNTDEDEWDMGKRMSQEKREELYEMLYLRDEIRIATDIVERHMMSGERFSAALNHPYAMATLCDLMENDRNGYSKISEAALCENMWRKRIVNGDVPVFPKLPSDPARVWSGKMGHYLDRLAFEVSQPIAEMMSSRQLKCADEIEVHLCIEANSFNTKLSTRDLKEMESELKVDKSVSVMSTDREARIRKASRGLCPYTGLPLDGSGQFDHIVSKRYCRHGHGHVLNSEANLIFVSAAGNQQKKQIAFTIKNLNGNYLRAVFDSADRAKIEKKIVATVLRLKKQNRLTAFEVLSEKEQDCVRHALFLNDCEARRTVMAVIEQHEKTAVNGSQAFFLKCLSAKLKASLTKELADNVSCVQFVGHCLPVQADRRKAVELAYPMFRDRGDGQLPVSHVLDARLIALAADADNEPAENVSVETVVAGLPRTITCKDVKRKRFEEKRDIWSRKLFDDTVWSADFLPIFVRKGCLFVGYDHERFPGRKTWNGHKECLPVGGRKPLMLLRSLKPLLDFQGKIDLKIDRTYRINKAKAFEFIKTVNGKLKPSPTERKIVAFLKAMIFGKVRQSLETLCDVKGEGGVLSLKPLKPDDFTLHVKAGSKADFCLDGHLLMPDFFVWQRLSQDIAGLMKKRPVDGADLALFWEEKLLKSGLETKTRALQKMAYSRPVPVRNFNVIVKKKTAEGRLFYEARLLADSIRYPRAEPTPILRHSLKGVWLCLSCFFSPDQKRPPGKSH